MNDVFLFVLLYKPANAGPVSASCWFLCQTGGDCYVRDCPTFRK